MILNRLARPADFTVDGILNKHPFVTDETIQSQHPARAWEYSLALYALDVWMGQRGIVNPVIADIGGAGSNFWRTFHHYTRKPSYRIDPNHEAGPDGKSIAFRQTLAEYMREEGKPFDVVFCISVIEHVPEAELLDFTTQLGMLVKPRGLLFLTTDVGEKEPDIYHFHWMRSRIYTPETLAALGYSLTRIRFSSLGLSDLTWNGPAVYDYTFGALALVKDPQ